MIQEYKGLWRPSILLPAPTQSVCGFRQVASPYTHLRCYEIFKSFVYIKGYFKHSR